MERETKKIISIIPVIKNTVTNGNFLASITKRKGNCVPFVLFRKLH